MHGHRFVTLVALLELEGDGDCVGEGEILIVVWDEATLRVETEVSELECSCPAHLVGNIGAKIFARAHGKEYCTNA